jgi:hypothetical protein
MTASGRVARTINPKRNLGAPFSVFEGGAFDFSSLQLRAYTFQHVVFPTFYRPIRILTKIIVETSDTSMLFFTCNRRHALAPPSQSSPQPDPYLS